LKFGQLHGEADGLVAVHEGGVTRLGGAIAGIGTLDELVAAGPDAWAQADAVVPHLSLFAESCDQLALAAPLMSPSKVIGVGLNYRDHARESGVELPTTPLIFAKFPSAIVGPDASIHVPALATEVDWEVELAVVIGLRARDVPPEAALDHVFGYTVANDLSARDLQFGDGQWVRSKSFDGFCPVGPLVVTPDEFGDPQAARLSARVNGETMQDSTTAEMVFSVAELVSSVSAWATLEPGDLILTGTPWGVGAFRSPPIYLQPGDEVEVEIHGIGVLRNRIARAHDLASITAAASPDPTLDD
jgi:2-keto-4-pentenoate hydratase/2-oxohepta-3-ene-1,7-dioic acid hydratase in catechol pathway